MSYLLQFLKSTTFWSFSGEIAIFLNGLYLKWVTFGWRPVCHRWCCSHFAAPVFRSPCNFTKSGGQAYLRLKCEDEVRGMKQAAGRQFCWSNLFQKVECDLFPCSWESHEKPLVFCGIWVVLWLMQPARGIPRGGWTHSSQIGVWRGPTPLRTSWARLRWGRGLPPVPPKIEINRL